ncbi:cupredoxin domain-containing protein [Fictibacillus sp. WQ 8-8]|nr:MULTISPECIES: cupredoxin domain-containing protein [unclassified Fictibacillus]MCQ6267631.1 cupredoxin domain-containing protein [Fictibacillus sp. WQ 8-8]UZJ77841.1 cupredoxin domain-containing protein [Fictibacillus sp. KU28468]SFE75738.1 Cupredoxin-like domain-containing protein [Bacillus sp. OV194]
MKVLYVPRKWILAFILCIGIGLGTWYVVKPEAVQTAGSPAASKRIVINMVTGEFKSKLDNGKEIEAYRWDPGTIHIPHNQPVTLSIYGVNGKEHPFYIEGTNVKGNVVKGKETVLHLRFKKEGIYRLICKTHADISHNGPMIAYLVVD